MKKVKSRKLKKYIVEKTGKYYKQFKSNAF